MARTRPDYSDQPTIVVGITEDGLGGVTFEGWPAETPEPRVVVRDYSVGNEPDEHGDLYEDEIV